MGDRKGILFVLSAPSGAGKTSIRQRLLPLLPDLAYSVSYATRPARPGEQDGIDYHFVSEDRFRCMVEEGEFLEWAKVHGNLYGTSLATLEKEVKAGRDVILDIDVQGADQILGRYDLGPVVRIFVLPPSAQALSQRLRNRASESQAQLLQRLRRAQQEILCYRDYDFVVVNHELDQATRQVACIIEAERCRSVYYRSLDALYSSR